MISDRAKDEYVVFEFKNEQKASDVMTEAAKKYFGDKKPSVKLSFITSDNTLFLVDSSKQKSFLEDHLEKWLYCDGGNFNGKYFLSIALMDIHKNIMLKNYVLARAIEHQDDKVNA